MATKPYSQRIPSLHNGISTQAPSSRFPSQVADAENALFNVVSGVSTRGGSRHVVILDQTGSAALAASLHWTELTVKAPSAAVYVCLAGASSCGANTTNKLSVATGATLVLPVTGLSLQTISLYGTGIIGSAVQVCGFFRVHP